MKIFPAFRRSLTPWLIFFVGAICSGVVCYIIVMSKRTSFRETFERDCHERALAIQGQIQSNYNALQTFSGYFAGKERLFTNLTLFNDYCTLIGTDTRYSISNVGLAVRVEHAEREQIEAAIGKPIRTAANHIPGTPWANQTEHRVYYPLIVEQAYETSIGVDQLSHRSPGPELLEEALYSGNVTSSMFILHTQRPGPGTGSWVIKAFFPYYTTPVLSPDLTREERFNRSIGVIMGILEPVTIMDRASEVFVNQLGKLEVELYDATPNQPPDFRPESHIAKSEDVSGSLNWDEAITELFHAADRTLELRCIPSSKYVNDETPLIASLSTVGILIFFAMMALLVRSNALRVERVESLLQSVDHAREDAERANQSKTQFLAFICHELRNPLNAVVGVTDWLFDETDLSSTQLEYLQCIRSSTNLMIAIVNDVLDLGKLEAGRIEFESLPIPLREFLDNVLAMSNATAQAKRLDLRLEVENSIPAVILSDPTRLTQVFANLIGNSLKFTREGSITIQSRSEPLESFDSFPEGYSPPPGDEGHDWKPYLMRFAVTDTGIGISENASSSLFQPYSQLNVSVLREHGGSGLGLSIVKNIITGMKGSIGVDSELGRGTTVYFTLPVLASMTYENKHDDDESQDVQYNAAASSFALDLAPNPNNTNNNSNGNGTSTNESKDSDASKPLIARHLPASVTAASHRSSPLQIVRKLGDRLRHSPSSTKRSLQQPQPPSQLLSLPSVPAHTSSSPSLSPPPSQTPLYSAVDISDSESDMPWSPRFHDASPDPIDTAPAVQLTELKQALPPTSTSTSTSISTSAASSPNFTRRTLNRKVTVQPLYKNHRVLVAEDNVINQRIVTRMLNEHGFDVDIAANGKEAVDAVNSNPGLYDFILMDLQMPVMRGHEAAVRIRSDGHMLPIIALSGSCLSEQRKQCEQDGMNDFLTKPLLKPSLADIVRRYARPVGGSLPLSSSSSSLPLLTSASSSAASS